MQSIHGVASYWKYVAWRALQDAWSKTGPPKSKIITGAVAVLIAAALLWGIAYYSGQEDGFQQATGKILWFALILVAELSVPFLVYGFFFIRTPYVLREELMKEIKQIEQRLQLRFDDVSAKLVSVETELHGLKDQQRLQASRTKTHAVAHLALNKMRQELADLVTSSKDSRPLSGGQYILPKQQQEHSQQMKSSLSAWLQRARDAASSVSLEDYLATETGLAECPLNYYDLEKFAQRQTDAIGAILSNLG